MSRETILERVRTALDAAPARRRPRHPKPASAFGGRRRRTDRAVPARAGKVGGKFHVAASKEEALALVARLIEGRTAVASNSPYLAECGITGSKECGRVHGRSPVARGLRHRRRRHHQRRLRTGRHRHAGHALLGARGAHDLALAADARGRGPARDYSDRPGRTFYNSAESGGGHQLDGPHHRPSRTPTSSRSWSAASTAPVRFT